MNKSIETVQSSKRVRLVVDAPNMKAGLPSRAALSRSYANRRDGGHASAEQFAREQAEGG